MLSLSLSFTTLKSFRLFHHFSNTTCFTKKAYIQMYRNVCLFINNYLLLMIKHAKFMYFSRQSLMSICEQEWWGMDVRYSGWRFPDIQIISALEMAFTFVWSEILLFKFFKCPTFLSSCTICESPSVSFIYLCRVTCFSTSFLKNILCLMVNNDIKD